MLPLLALSLAIAAPSERLQRLADERNWSPAHALCTRIKAHTSTDDDTRELCATAAYRTEPPSGSPALHRFALRWEGTESGWLAFERAAAAAEPGGVATEVQLLDHMKSYADTEAADRSAKRIETAAWTDASATNAEVVYLGFIQRFPDGKFAGEARMAALEAGLAEAIDGSAPEAFEDLVVRYPDAEDRIRSEAARWSRTAWLRALSGPCWTTGCGSLQAGQPLELGGPAAVGGAVPQASWVLLRDGGEVVRDLGVLSRAMGIDGGEWQQHAAFDGGRWVAPFDWAQPPEHLGLTWALEVSIETEDAQLVPLEATDTWLGVHETFYAWGPQGIDAWVQGQAEPLMARAPVGEPRLLEDGDSLWAIDDVTLTRFDLRTGEQRDVPAPRRLQGLAMAGPGSFVAWQDGRRVRCGLRGCTPYARDVLGVAPGNGRTVTGAELAWTVRDADGSILRDQPRPYNPGDLPLPEATLDHTGQRLLVVSYAPSPPSIRALPAVFTFIDLATGTSVESSATVGYVERAEAAGYADAFILTVRDCIDCDAPTRSVLLERQEGRLTVVPADAATLALARRGPWRAQRPEGFPEGTDLDVRRSGDGVEVTLLRDVLNPVQMVNRIAMTPEGCDPTPTAASWWMGDFRYMWATVALYTCRDQTGVPTRIETAQVLVDAVEGTVWEAGDVDETAAFISHDGRSIVLRSWTEGTRILGPDGVTILPEGTRHGLWGPGAPVLATLIRSAPSDP